MLGVRARQGQGAHLPSPRGAPPRAQRSREGVFGGPRAAGERRWESRRSRHRARSPRPMQLLSGVCARHAQTEGGPGAGSSRRAQWEAQSPGARIRGWARRRRCGFCRGRYRGADDGRRGARQRRRSGSDHLVGLRRNGGEACDSGRSRRRHRRGGADAADAVAPTSRLVPERAAAATGADALAVSPAGVRGDQSVGCCPLAGAAIRRGRRAARRCPPHGRDERRGSVLGTCAGIPAHRGGKCAGHFRRRRSSYTNRNVLGSGCRAEAGPGPGYGWPRSRRWLGHTDNTIVERANDKRSGRHQDNAVAHRLRHEHVHDAPGLVTRKRLRGPSDRSLAEPRKRGRVVRHVRERHG